MFQEDNYIEPYQTSSSNDDFSTVKGMQVLIIDDVEVLFKNQGETYSETGSLNVLFVPEYSRFVLHLNNWFYALIKDLPIKALDTSSSGLCSYILPSKEGAYVLNFGRQSSIREVHSLQALLRNKAKVIYDENKSTDNELISLAGIARESNVNKYEEVRENQNEENAQNGNNLEESDPDIQTRDGFKRENNLKGAILSLGRQLSNKITSWKRNTSTVAQKYEAVGYGAKLLSAFDEDLTCYVDREEVQKAIVSSMEVIKKSKLEEVKTVQGLKELHLSKKISSNNSDDMPKSPLKAMRRLSSTNYAERKDTYVEKEADLKAMLRTRIDLEERVEYLRSYIHDGIDVDNMNKMEYECKKLQLDELDELISSTEVELEGLQIQLFGSVQGGRAVKLNSKGSEDDDKEGIMHQEAHLQFADQVDTDEINGTEHPKFGKGLSKRLPGIEENYNEETEGRQSSQEDISKSKEFSQENEITFKRKPRRHQSGDATAASSCAKLIFDRREIVNANDFIMTKLAMKDLKLNEEDEQPADVAQKVIDLEKKVSQRHAEEKDKEKQAAGEGRQVEAEAEKEEFVMPELSSWKKANIKVRSIIPSIITCHHIWWAIHLAVTGVLLWLYFTDRLNIKAGTIAVFELLIGVFFRNEIVITLLHFAFAYIPFGKRFFNRMLHCIGGVHTSAALMVVIWLMIGLCLERSSTAVLVTGSILFAIVVILSITALPPIRRKYHNSFEYMHRFVGWTGLGVLIAHVVLLVTDSQGISVGEAFASASVIMVLLITVIIFLPWVLVGRTKVSWRQPSSLLTVATFKGTYNPYGTVSRVSFNGLEWHAFAIALVDADKDTHSLVIAKAGDWTGRVSDGCSKGTLPGKIWTRKMKGIGFMYSIHAYRKVLIVCTGSGIAPALPYIKNPIPTTSTHVLWIAKKHRQVFGDFLMDMVEKTAPNYTLHDTGVNGRPSVDLVIEWFYRVKAEAVFVVSNEPFTDQIVNGCWKKAVPAYGALFDS